MKFTFEVATVQVAIVSVSSISVCALSSVVVGTDNSTSLLQGYTIGVITLIAYMGIVASLKK